MPIASTPAEREQQLTVWTAEALKSLAGVNQPDKSIALNSIASDAGFRRYFRFSTPSQWLAVDAPPETEDSRQFVALARYLGNHNVHTPKILVADENQGFLLVEDFGDDLLYRQLTRTNAAQHYRQTFSSLLGLQACPDSPSLIPRYDRALLRRELDIFSEWFIGKMLGYALDDAENGLLNTLFLKLEAAALAQPQTLVHRDFHSRNLIIRPDSALGIIDFQGALWGPCTYDLVSLLRDCYIRWPAELTKGLALEYRQLAIENDLLSDDIDEAQYLHWFDWMGLQRHIKVLGIFARLNLRDNKPHYLKDLPLVIRYTLEVAQAYPELEQFADWFKARILPLAKQQSWYTDYHHAGDAQ